MGRGQTNRPAENILYGSTGPRGQQRVARQLTGDAAEWLDKVLDDMLLLGPHWGGLDEATLTGCRKRIHELKKIVASEGTYQISDYDRNVLKAVIEGLRALERDSGIEEGKCSWRGWAADDFEQLTSD